MSNASFTPPGFAPADSSPGWRGQNLEVKGGGGDPRRPVEQRPPTQITCLVFMRRDLQWTAV
jgi:hypothetical protein